MSTRDPAFNKQIAEEAAAWFVDFSVGDVEPEQRAHFNEWLRRSPLHVRAYLQVTALWEDAALLKLDTAALEALAGRIASEGNVIPLREAGMRTPVIAAPKAAPNLLASKSRIPARRVGRWFAIAACVSLLSVIIGFAVWTRTDRGVTYVTETGEQGTVTLTDGSVVQLNSQSRLRVQFSEQVRQVELIEGQALFEVAKNPARPFVVVSGKTSVQAVGTQFDVYRKSAGTVVTVLEGRVAVSEDTARVPMPVLVSKTLSQQERSATGSSAVLLSAGEQIVITPTAMLAPQTTNVDAAVAWTQKKLVFDAAPLSEVVAEFNRYSHRQLVLDEATLDEIRISGVFSSTGVEHLVQFLQQRFDVIATTTDEQVHLSRQP